MQALGGMDPSFAPHQADCVGKSCSSERPNPISLGRYTSHPILSYSSLQDLQDGSYSQKAEQKRWHLALERCHTFPYMPYRRKRCYRQPREAGGEPMVLSHIHCECSIASGEKGGKCRSCRSESFRCHLDYFPAMPMKISAQVVKFPKKRAEMVAEI